MWKIVCVLIAVFTVSACVPLHHHVENPPQRYYIVQPGDTSYSIAITLEVDPKQLYRANPWLDPAHIAPGMRLFVPDYPRQENTAITRYSYDIDNDDVDEDFDYDDGENQAQNSDQIDTPIQRTGFIWPLNTINVSSRYGYRRGRLHAGIDLTAPRGTSIYASAAGKIVFSGYQRSYGYIVVIDHGGGTETAYAHNSRNLVDKGQRVKQGQTIARVGRSGNATGYHVHFEYRRYGKAVDPVRHVQAAL